MLNKYGNDRSNIFRFTINTENQKETVLKNKRGFYFFYIQKP